MKKIYPYASVILLIFGFLATFPVVTSAQTAPAASCPLITQPLYYEMSGQTTAITALQSFLVEKGYLSVQPTGFYGPSTLAAVEKFQNENAISPTGFVGIWTDAAIEGACSPTQSLTVSAPAAGTAWTDGSSETISWTATTSQMTTMKSVPPNAVLYNVLLAPVPPACAAGQVCPMYLIRPYTIEDGLGSYGNYSFTYNWTVGSTTDMLGSAPAGQYKIQVCVYGGNSCANSGAFSIVAATSSVQ